MVYPISEETREKMRNAHLGKKHSIETILKIVQTRRTRGSYMAWNKGIPLSEDIKKKISEALTGNSSPKKNKTYQEMYGINKSNDIKRKVGLKSQGRVHTEKWKRNMREFHKNNPTISQFKKNHVPWNKGLKGVIKSNSGSFKEGHTISEEHKKRISKRHKGKQVSQQTIEKIKIKRINQILPVRDTKIEVKIQMFLKELGYDFFTHQYIKDIEHGYQCDILIPTLNLVIECDGDYWHKYPIGTDLDYIRTKELLEKGFKVLRLWEKEINVMNIEDFKKRLNDNA